MADDFAAAPDDLLTIISISALASILQDVLHEGLGHGVTAWLSGAHQITISTVAMQAEIDNRWIEANGTLVNLIFGAIFWILLLQPGRYRPATRYFLVLAMMGNLFTGTGYFFFSGVSNYGDWAAVIHGLHPHWIWQAGLVVLGVATYFASMLLVAAKLKPFHGAQKPRRVRGLCWTPYIPTEFWPEWRDWRTPPDCFTFSHRRCRPRWARMRDCSACRGSSGDGTARASGTAKTKKVSRRYPEAMAGSARRRWWYFSIFLWLAGGLPGRGEPRGSPAMFPKNALPPAAVAQI
jgi:hypothetical protein